METNKPDIRILSQVARLALIGASLPLAIHAALDTTKIDNLTGLKGVWNEAEMVHKVSQPRTDLPVSVEQRMFR